MTGPDMFFMGKIDLMSFSLKNPELHRFRKDSVKYPRRSCVFKRLSD